MRVLAYGLSDAAAGVHRGAPRRGRSRARAAAGSAGGRVPALLAQPNPQATVLHVHVLDLHGEHRAEALLALGPSLDALYQDVGANAFTAEELQIAR
jgi:hypothetical protein